MTAPAPLWSFLGPAGTFTEMALRQVAPVDVELDPCPDVPTALDHLRERTVEAAVVPIENSVEGGVNATLDNLVASTPLVIAAEMAVPITFVLAGRPGTRLEDVRAISTHPHAWAQCRGWVHQSLPEAVYVAGTSTSAPARALATTEGDTGFQAVLCNPLAAKQYGLEVIAGGVADNPDAVTRFVKVTRPGRVGEPTGADKTTLLVHLPHDRSGALLDMLEQFSARGVNLSRIESRPVGDSLGRYRFSIDVEGHVREERVQAALIGLHRTCPVVRFLGSYPRLDARPTAVLAASVAPGRSSSSRRTRPRWPAPASPSTRSPPSPRSAPWGPRPPPAGRARASSWVTSPWPGRAMTRSPRTSVGSSSSFPARSPPPVHPRRLRKRGGADDAADEP